MKPCGKTDSAVLSTFCLQRFNISLAYTLHELVGNEMQSFLLMKIDARKNNDKCIIIIITNEKIKVILSPKRCRDTLQDYNKEEISECQSKLWTNRSVFSWCLNGTREETVRRDGGRLYRKGVVYRSLKSGLHIGRHSCKYVEYRCILSGRHIVLLSLNSLRELPHSTNVSQDRGS